MTQLGTNIADDITQAGPEATGWSWSGYREKPQVRLVRAIKVCECLRGPDLDIWCLLSSLSPQITY